MIKLHDGVAVNPVNVVSIKMHDDDMTVTVFLWNGRVHNVRCQSVEEMRNVFDRLYNGIAGEIDLLAVDNECAVNTDAIVSIAKVDSGVAINLITGNHIKISGSDVNGLFTNINNRICNEAA